MYQDMFDDQIAMQMSKGKGLGLADMLVRQLQGGVGSDGRRAQRSAAASSATTQASDAGCRFERRFPPHDAPARRAGRARARRRSRRTARAGRAGNRLGPLAAVQRAGRVQLQPVRHQGRQQWSGATVNVPTLEFESGIPVRKVERFRAYDSPADSFRDYAALIRDNSRYASARGTGDNVEAFATALQQGGYATDPDYAQKIAAVADEVRARSDAAQVCAAADAVNVPDTVEDHRMADLLSTGVSGPARFPARARYDQPQHRERQHRRLQPPARADRHASGAGLRQRLDRAGRQRPDDAARLRRVRRRSRRARPPAASSTSISTRPTPSGSTTCSATRPTGLSATLQKFVNAFQSVANTPASMPARQVLLSEANTLQQRLKSYDSRLDDIGNEINTRIKGEVGRDQHARAGHRAAEQRDHRGHRPAPAASRRTTCSISATGCSISCREKVSVNAVEPGRRHGQRVRRQRPAAGARRETSTSSRPCRIRTIPRGSRSRLQTPGSSVDISRNISGGTLGGLLDFRSEHARSGAQRARPHRRRADRRRERAASRGHRPDRRARRRLLRSRRRRGAGEQPATPAPARSRVTRTDVGALTGRDYILEMTGGGWHVARFA